MSRDMSDTKIHDLFVIGGGINGCGIARDAAGRGLGGWDIEKGPQAAATMPKTKDDATVKRDSLWRAPPPRG